VNPQRLARRLGAPPLLAAVVVFGSGLIAAVDRATPLSAYADGAPPGFSGGFREESCHACHFDADVDTRPGEVMLTGVPGRFIAGERYPLTVTLSRPGMALGGFQLAARFDDGAQAGTLERGEGEESRVAIETQGGVQYAGQRRAGTRPVSENALRWTIVWTAPQASRPVTFHVAANAADNDESARGDYVYTAAATAAPAAPSR
jgi:hypothetical protein